MGSCVAYNCKNRCSMKIPGLTFHRFPKDEIRRKLWVIAVRRADWEPSSCSRLCSKHFPEDMIDRTSLSCVRLRENAIPSIFDFSSELKRASRKQSLRKADIKIETQPATNGVEPAEIKLEVDHSSSESHTIATHEHEIKLEVDDGSSESHTIATHEHETKLEVDDSSSESHTIATHEHEIKLEVDDSSSESHTIATHEHEAVELENITVRKESKNSKLIIHKAPELN